MKRTFFEYLGLADVEKVHSQILKWIFKDNDSLTNQQKTKLIHLIFGIDNFEIKEIITEYEHIDIVFFSKDGVICIENKIKSSQSENQLQGYLEKINTDKNFKNKHYFFLTLINEDSLCKEWKNISYKHILKCLNSINIIENNDGVFLREYMATLTRFEYVIEKFIEKPSSFPNVFFDANKSKKLKKLDSTLLNNDQQFIKDNQLETIFQKMYFTKIALEVGLQNYYIVETHGNVILGTYIKENIEIDGNNYRMGFDYQNGTFKTFFIDCQYLKSKKENLPTKVPILFNTATTKVEYGYKLKTNSSKNKAYHSMTKRKAETIGLNISEFAKIYLKEFEISKKIITNEFHSLFQT